MTDKVYRLRIFAMFELRRGLFIFGSHVGADTKLTDWADQDK